MYKVIISTNIEHRPMPRLYHTLIVNYMDSILANIHGFKLILYFYCSIMLFNLQLDWINLQSVFNILCNNCTQNQRI